MANNAWLDRADNREVHREYLNITISGEFSCEQRDLARDALCVLDSYEALRVERDAALIEIKRLRGEVVTRSERLLEYARDSPDKAELITAFAGWKESNEFCFQALAERDAALVENAALWRVYYAAKACDVYLTAPFATDIETCSTMHHFLSKALAAVPARDEKKGEQDND